MILGPHCEGMYQRRRPFTKVWQAEGGGKASGGGDQESCFRPVQLEMFQWKCVGHLVNQLEFS